MIHGNILPADRIMNFPASQQRLKGENPVTAVCATDPEITEKLEDMVFEECDAHIMVSQTTSQRVD